MDGMFVNPKKRGGWAGSNASQWDNSPWNRTSVADVVTIGSSAFAAGSGPPVLEESACAAPASAVSTSPDPCRQEHGGWKLERG